MRPIGDRHLATAPVKGQFKPRVLRDDIPLRCLQFGLGHMPGIKPLRLKSFRKAGVHL